MTKASYKRTHLLCSCFLRARVHDGVGKEQLGAHILKHNHRQRNSGTPPPTTAYFPSPSQKGPQILDQIFKCIYAFKHPELYIFFP